MAMTSRSERPDGLGLRRAVEMTTGQFGLLDLRRPGEVVFTPAGGAPRVFVWRSCTMVGGSLMRFVAADGGVHLFRDQTRRPSR
jgi:hypothetical protein